MSAPTNAHHKIDGIQSVGTSGAVVIGCVCGWVHRAPWGRKDARAAFAKHKAQS